MISQNHFLYGRRILHYLSPVRWKAKEYDFERCSNFKAVMKTLYHLPMCHHYILFPRKNTETGRGKHGVTQYLAERGMDKNVTILPFNYPASVLKNRTYFDSRLLENTFKFGLQDIDFVFNHQPEVTFNIMNSLLSKRYGTSVHIFQFFHWVDSPKSRPTDSFTPNFWRQLEGIYLSDKSFIHCNLAVEYIKENFKDDNLFPFSTEFLKNKISYYTAGIDKKKQISEAFDLPDKKILLFNHRWNHTTGIKKLVNFSRRLDFNKYVIWLTDEEAKSPKAGRSVFEEIDVINKRIEEDIVTNEEIEQYNKDNNANEPKINIKSKIDPRIFHVESLSSAKYQYLVENSFAALCFVDKYATWNLSVQETIHAGIPTIVFHHPAMDYIIGKNYPLYFKKTEEFFEVLEKKVNPDNFDWKLPDHEDNFKKNLYSSMINTIEQYNSSKREKNETGRVWLYHILNGNGYKKGLLKNTFPDLWLSNNWEHLRRWCLLNGAKDDPNSKQTRMFIPDENKKKVAEMVKDINDKIEFDITTTRTVANIHEFFEIL